MEMHWDGAGSGMVLDANLEVGCGMVWCLDGMVWDGDGSVVVLSEVKCQPYHPHVTAPSFTSTLR